MNDSLERLPLRVPQLGGSLDLEIRIAGWLVEQGEMIRQGDRLVELLLPGVVYHVHSPATGYLQNQIPPAGTIVHAGDLLGQIAVDESLWT